VRRWRDERRQTGGEVLEDKRRHSIRRTRGSGSVTRGVLTTSPKTRDKQEREASVDKRRQRLESRRRLKKTKVKVSRQEDEKRRRSNSYKIAGKWG
jgi:hypothetical protein